MKKFLSLILALVLLVSLMGCAQTKAPAAEPEAPAAAPEAPVEEPAAPTEPPDETPDYSDTKVALLLPGTLGDQSFFDLTVQCVPMIKEAYGIEVKVVEMGYDTANWLPCFQDYGDLGYDVVMSLSGADPQIQQAAEMYPDTTFMDVSGVCENGLPNLLSVGVKANELSFFGGVMAALKAEELGEDTIGFLGGMDLLAINYFLVGYIDGARSVNPDIKVVSTYAGSFNDPTTAKENALLLYESGISVIYAAAGGSGLGVMDAAASLGKYTIGVDVDQYEQLKDSSPDLANTIITSCVQNIPGTATMLVGQFLDGTLVCGSHSNRGIAEGAVEIVVNENTKKLLSAESLAKLEELKVAFVAGELEYNVTNFDDGSTLDEASVAAIIASAQP